MSHKVMSTEDDTAKALQAEPKQASTSREFDAGTWYESMIAAGQTPWLADWWGSGRTQLEFTGRDYDDNHDRSRWSQLQLHRDAVVSFLRERNCWVPGFEPGA